MNLAPFSMSYSIPIFFLYMVLQFSFFIFSKCLFKINMQKAIKLLSWICSYPVVLWMKLQHHHQSIDTGDILFCGFFLDQCNLPLQHLFFYPCFFSHLLAFCWFFLLYSVTSKNFIFFIWKSLFCLHSLTLTQYFPRIPFFAKIFWYIISSYIPNVICRCLLWSFHFIVSSCIFLPKYFFMFLQFLYLSF